MNSDLWFELSLYIILMWVSGGGLYKVLKYKEMSHMYGVKTKKNSPLLFITHVLIYSLVFIFLIYRLTWFIVEILL